MWREQMLTQPGLDGSHWHWWYMSALHVVGVVCRTLHLGMHAVLFGFGMQRALYSHVIMSVMLEHLLSQMPAWVFHWQSLNVAQASDDVAR